MPKKQRAPYPATLKPIEECHPIARWLGTIMLDQQRAIRLIGGLAMPRSLIEGSMVPVADRLITYCLPGGLVGDALMIGPPLVTGTVAQIGIRKLLAQGAVIQQGEDGNPCIKLPDGTILQPSPDPDADPVVVSMATRGAAEPGPTN